MSIHRPLGEGHPAYERAAEEREVRGLVFEVASMHVLGRDQALGELVAGWHDQAQAIIARYFGEAGCVGCGLAANACGFELDGGGPNLAYQRARAAGKVRAKLGICADCVASTYRDAFLDAIDERVEVEA